MSSLFPHSASRRSRLRVRALFAIVCAAPMLLSSASSSTRQSGASSQALATEQRRAVAQQLRTDGSPAQDYVVGKFADHDLVLLGEGPHRVRQNLEFLQALIPKLHAAGVYNLGYEMVRSVAQPDLDRLLSGQTYDEALANRIILDWEHVHFGWYREYADVLRAAWLVNSRLPAGAQKFRIVGLDAWYMPTDWSQIRPGEKGGSPAVTRRVLGVRGRDIHWAEVIDREIVQKGEKGLIYGGAGHLGTRFHADEGFGTHIRWVGNLLHEYLGDKLFGIYLHGSHPSEEDTRMLDSLFSALPEASAGIGFDVRQGTAIGTLPSATYGFQGRGPRSRNYEPPMRCGNDFVLSDTMDGYVYLVPRAQWKMVRRIEGVLTPENVREIGRRLQVESGEPSRTFTRQDIERMSEETDRKWRALIEIGAPR